MRYKDFSLLRKGWNDKLIYEQSIYRRMTMIIASSMVGSKNINPKKLWPLPGEQNNIKMVQYGGVQMTERQMMKLKRLKQNG
jgi:hypothetical protein